MMRWDLQPAVILLAATISPTNESPVKHPTAITHSFPPAPFIEPQQFVILIPIISHQGGLDTTALARTLRLMMRVFEDV